MNDAEPSERISNKRRFGTFIIFYTISNITLIVIMVASAFGVDRTGHDMNLFWLYFVIFLGGMGLVPWIFYHVTKRTESESTE